MSEPNTLPVASESSTQTSPGPTPVPQRRHPFFTLSRVFAVAALALVLAVWLLTYRQIGALENELAKRLSGFETRNNESQLLARQAQEATREVQAKVAVLEQKLVESQNQQIALEAMYQDVARGRDEANLAEIEQLVFGASQQLQVSGNVKAALISLQAADSRLQRIDKPQFLALRKVINKDIDRLRASPSVDVGGNALRLDQVIEEIDQFELLPGKPGAPAAPPKQTADGAWWQRFAVEAWSDLTTLLRIQNMEKAALPLLPPEQAYYARENLRLRLLAARLSLLSHDEAAYRRDLKFAQVWIARYFDEKDKTVKNAVAVLQQLAGSPVRVDVPDISASVNAVRGFKLAPERGR